MRDGDDDLIDGVLKTMEEGAADFTLTFRRLTELAQDGGDDPPVRELFSDPAAFDAWAVQWRARLGSETRDDAARQASMRAVNPAYIPRNHLVEAALDAAVENGDLEPLHDLRAVLQTPFASQPGQERYEQPPKPEEEVKATFCGT